MNTIETEILNAAESLDPTSPVVEVAGAAAATAASPNPATILADLELAITLVKDFKAKLAGIHPTVINIIKLLF